MEKYDPGPVSNVLLKADVCQHMPNESLKHISNPVAKVVYTLKAPYRDGTTRVAFDPVDFIAHLAVLAPTPRVNLTRYHCVLAPNHRWHVLVTPVKRGKGMKRIANTENCTLSRASCRNNLDATAQASVQYRHQSLRPLRRICTDHRMHRGPWQAPTPIRRKLTQNQQGRY